MPAACARRVRGVRTVASFTGSLCGYKTTWPSSHNPTNECVSVSSMLLRILHVNILSLQDTDRSLCHRNTLPKWRAAKVENSDNSSLQCREIAIDRRRCVGFDLIWFCAIATDLAYLASCGQFDQWWHFAGRTETSTASAKHSLRHGTNRDSRKNRRYMSNYWMFWPRSKSITVQMLKWTIALSDKSLINSQFEILSISRKIPNPHQTC